MIMVVLAFAVLLCFFRSIQLVAEQLLVRMSHCEIGMCTIPNLALEIPIAVKTDLPLFKKFFKMCGVCAASLVKVVHITQIWVK